jgi:hypothetical protein
MATPSSSPPQMVNELRRGEDTFSSDPRLPPKPEVTGACDSEDPSASAVPAAELGRDFDSWTQCRSEPVHGVCSCEQDQDASSAQWGILLPTCSRGKDASTCFQDLGKVAASLERTTEAHERKLLSLHIGIDMYDEVYDSPESIMRLKETFSSFGSIRIHKLQPAYQGKICWIWEKLAQEAIDDGAEYFVLLGDDIDMRSMGWKHHIEEAFKRIAAERCLPVGVACVAFQDEAFPMFPTFPVLHRMHCEVFGRLFPQALINQHGDPFVFEVYRRFGAAVFSSSARLCNTVGGSGAARYTKEKSVLWRDGMLTEFIHTLDTWLNVNKEKEGERGGKVGKGGNNSRAIPCIDVVVPTYRCDVKMLARICGLRTTAAASICKLIVVDRPDAANLQDVLALQSWRENDVVRVCVMEKNEGAGEARNRGLSQSFGDHAVLLDDDIVPEETLLDA